MEAATAMPRAKSRQVYTITHLSTASSVLENMSQLSQILKICVDEGSSIGFLSPLSIPDAEIFWTSILTHVTAGTNHLYILTSATSATPDLILGTVQLVTIPKATHKHRAEVVKLLVRPEGRRKGVARALMAHVEGAAKGMGMDLLTLDTATLSDAMPMYRALGWEEWGTCKGYACFPDGSRCDATFFSKHV